MNPELNAVATMTPEEFYKNRISGVPHIGFYIPLEDGGYWYRTPTLKTWSDVNELTAQGRTLELAMEQKLLKRLPVHNSHEDAIKYLVKKGIRVMKAPTSLNGKSRKVLKKVDL